MFYVYLGIVILISNLVGMIIASVISYKLMTSYKFMKNLSVKMINIQNDLEKDIF